MPGGKVFVCDLASEHAGEMFAAGNDWVGAGVCRVSSEFRARRCGLRKKVAQMVEEMMKGGRG